MRRIWPVVVLQNPAHHILIDLNAKDVVDRLSDSWASEVGVALFDSYNHLDKFGGGSFRTGIAFPGAAEQPAIFPFDHGLVKPKDSRWFDKDGRFGHSLIF